MMNTAKDVFKNGVYANANKQYSMLIDFNKKIHKHIRIHALFNKKKVFE